MDLIMALLWQSDVGRLPGVGQVRRQALASLGIETVGDLLLHFPRAYQNRGDVKTVLEAAGSGEKCALILTVGSEPRSVQLKGRMTLTTFSLFDDTGRVTAIWFNQNFVRQIFHVGDTFRFWGKVTRGSRGWELSSPDFEPVNGSRPLPDLMPVYPLTAGISQKMMQNLISLALASLEGAVSEVIPEKIRLKNRLCRRREAIEAIHLPEDLAALDQAKRYFIFEELYSFALAVTGAKRKRRKLTAPVIAIGEADWQAFLAALPFELTEGQRETVAAIRSDLCSGLAMRRLVSGDVGSGKTVCAAAAAYFAVKSGWQCALMAPTEILARQHYTDLSALFAPLSVQVELLVGSLTAAAKRKVKEKMSAGAPMLVIGTHALLSEGVSLPAGVLFITDEQHRFGVAQRTALTKVGTAGSAAANLICLSDKSPQSVHTLVMSATPIPRTLAMAIYGDLDVSAIRTMPPGRKKVSTFLVNEGYRTRMEGFIAKQAKEGRQTYIVCPSIESEETEEDCALIALDGRPASPLHLRNAVDYAAELSERLPGISVACLHGKMKGQEKDRIMADFAAGKTSVLVSTTVIEVGVNVPNATLMIVENAERFGLSQLHQLRGRVGRGAWQSWCILVSDSESEEALARLKALCQLNDGYEIAEFDLKQRGPGDFFNGSVEGSAGTGGAPRQHGALRFRMASLCEDVELLRSAFAAAEETENSAESADS